MMCLDAKPDALIATVAPSLSGSNHNTASGVGQPSMKEYPTVYAQDAEQQESGRHTENIDTFMEVE